jgi:glycosyltransferase involved in cell wall biosynthesis
MRVAYLAAGAGGMICGSCLRDNRIAASLIARGRDVVLIPLYTPIRTDEIDVSTRKVYFGGLSVYLEEKSALFRHLPRVLTRMLDSPRLLRRISKWAGKTDAADLGELTVSVLNGEHGAQRRELDELVRGLAAIKPDIVKLPNLMFLGMAESIKRALHVPILCTLSGEDIFVDQLIEPYRGRAFDLIRRNAGAVDGYVSVTNYFADHAARHFSLPREHIHVIPMGVRHEDFAEPAAPRPPFTIGYLARICSEKGLRQLCEAFTLLRRRGRDCRLRVAGYLGARDRAYFHETVAFVRQQGCGENFEYVGEVDLRGKIEFLRSLHVLSVPTVYHESKGFYVLEALASGVPVVQPRHGSFPELVEATGGGLLYDPTGPAALADAIDLLMTDEALRTRLARAGHDAVCAKFTDGLMADRTWALCERFVGALASRGL